MVSEVKQGLTTRLDPTAKDPSKLFNPDLPPARYAENLRIAFGLVGEWVASKKITPLNQLSTIHYARWVLMENDERLLFCSNFDGSWDQYLRDFVIVANKKVPTKYHPNIMPWMDLIWGNCVGYPGTDDYFAFTSWVRSQMIPTTLYFPSITDTTVRDIAWLRQFKQHFDLFDAVAQDVDRSTWPEDLLKAYDDFKKKANQIDVLVVTP